jgi:hypothetical protein
MPLRKIVSLQPPRPPLPVSLRVLMSTFDQFLSSNHSTKSAQTFLETTHTISELPETNGNPLYWASYCGNADRVTALLALANKIGLKNYVNCRTADENKETPLFIACFQGHEAVIKILIAHQANTALLTAYGIAIPYAAASQSAHCVSLLNPASISGNILDIAFSFAFKQIRIDVILNLLYGGARLSRAGTNQIALTIESSKSIEKTPESTEKSPKNIPSLFETVLGGLGKIMAEKRFSEVSWRGHRIQTFSAEKDQSNLTLSTTNSLGKPQNLLPADLITDFIPLLFTVAQNFSSAHAVADAPSSELKEEQLPPHQKTNPCLLQ